MKDSALHYKEYNIGDVIVQVRDGEVYLNIPPEMNRSALAKWMRQNRVELDDMRLIAEMQRIKSGNYTTKEDDIYCHVPDYDPITNRIMEYIKYARLVIGKVYIFDDRRFIYKGKRLKLV